jgi:hypothetical protein
MSSLINEPILESGFEKVRDRIGEILLLELTKQKQLQNFSEEINVYSEKSVPESSAEPLQINVLLDSGNYGTLNPKDAQGKTIYFIDIYTTSKESDGVTGDYAAAFLLHKYIRLCRFILQSSKYKTLGFPDGLIGGKSVEMFETLPPAQKQDARFTRFARITFSVRIQESDVLWGGITASSFETTVTLQETEQGYKYQFNT